MASSHAVFAPLAILFQNLEARTEPALSHIDFEPIRENIQILTAGDAVPREVTDRDVLSSILFPDVFRSFVEHRNEYGDTSVLDTPTFFSGLEL